MQCYEIDTPAPRHECHCACCSQARERSIPVRLMELATGRGEKPWDISPLSSSIIHRALSTYIAGHIGLAEMQIELIAALADQCDKQQKMLGDIAILRPLVLPETGTR